MKKYQPDIMNSIQFFFDGKIHTVNFDNLPPTTTLLKYIRSLPGRQGVKEGCAEGDCGACTVVIAELNNNKLKYRAVNSCLVLLPSVHGKWVITVEDLGQPENPHFIQTAFVQNFASQCGFCTPGFEMALYALIKENPNPTDEQINEAVEGNICRCTGYRPIRDAAASLRDVKSRDIVSDLEPTAIQELSKIKNSEPLVLKHKDFTYLIPFTIQQAVDLRLKYPEATIINGSTDIALRITKNKENIHTIIDLDHIKEIQYIKHEQNTLEIGAGTRIQDIKDFVKDVFPEFYELLKVFGAKQIRNRATIAGNIATSSPIGDLIPPLFAMNATLELTGKNKRTIPIEKFITGYRKNDLKNDEIITKVIIPLNSDYKYKFYKVSKRTHLDITTVSLAAAVKIHDNIITDIRLVYGGMAEVVKHAQQAENFLINKQINEQNFLQAANIAANEFTPISDARADAQARTILARNLIIKLYNDLINQL